MSVSYIALRALRQIRCQRSRSTSSQAGRYVQHICFRELPSIMVVLMPSVYECIGNYNLQIKTTPDELFSKGSEITICLPTISNP